MHFALCPFLPAVQRFTSSARASLASFKEAKLLLSIRPRASLPSVREPPVVQPANSSSASPEAARSSASFAVHRHETEEPETAPSCAAEGLFAFCVCPHAVRQKREEAQKRAQQETAGGKPLFYKFPWRLLSAWAKPAKRPFF